MTSEKNPEGGFMNQNKKIKKAFPLKPNTQPLNMQDQVQLDNGTTLIVDDSMLAGIEEKRISGNRSVKVHIFSGASTHDMYDYLKPLLEKNPDNIILHVGANNLVNETSRDILRRFKDKCCG